MLRSLLVRSLPFGRQKKPALVTLYDRFAPTWHACIARIGYLDAYRHLVAAHPIRPRGNAMRVLDVGTGSGGLALCFADAMTAPVELDLLDPSAAMLDTAVQTLARSGHRARAIRAEIGTPEVQENRYDVALCAHVIEHCPDPVAALRWIARVMAPDGTLVLSVSKPHWCTALIRWKWGHKAYEPEEVRSMLAAAGFSEIVQVPFKAGPPSRMSCGYRARGPAPPIPAEDRTRSGQDPARPFAVRPDEGRGTGDRPYRPDPPPIYPQTSEPRPSIV
ncbi:MAG: class I SAM-dependent methyltransferase [Pseudomonadota bacterium]